MLRLEFRIDRFAAGVFSQTANEAAEKPTRHR
jgi:hypothetical protein